MAKSHQVLLLSQTCTKYVRVCQMLRAVLHFWFPPAGAPLAWLIQQAWTGRLQRRIEAQPGVDEHKFLQMPRPRLAQASRQGTPIMIAPRCLARGSVAVGADMAVMLPLADVLLLARPTGQSCTPCCISSRARCSVTSQAEWWFPLCCLSNSR